MKLVLPSDYDNMKELPFQTKTPLFVPVCTVNLDYISLSEFIDIGIRYEMNWLEYATQIKGNSNISWSKYHANANRQQSNNVGLNALLPYITVTVSMHEHYKEHYTLHKSKSSACRYLGPACIRVIKRDSIKIPFRFRI